MQSVRVSSKKREKKTVCTLRCQNHKHWLFPVPRSFCTPNVTSQFNFLLRPSPDVARPAIKTPGKEDQKKPQKWQYQQPTKRRRNQEKHRTQNKKTQEKGETATALPNMFHLRWFSLYNIRSLVRTVTCSCRPRINASRRQREWLGRQRKWILGRGRLAKRALLSKRKQGLCKEASAALQLQQFSRFVRHKLFQQSFAKQGIVQCDWVMVTIPVCVLSFCALGFVIFVCSFGSLKPSYCAPLCCKNSKNAWPGVAFNATTCPFALPEVCSARLKHSSVDWNSSP